MKETLEGGWRTWARRRGSGMLVGLYVWGWSGLGWAAPGKKVPNETRLQDAEELEKEYVRLYGEGKYGEAAGVAERACSILKEEHGSESEEFAECINDLGVFYYEQGSYEEAKPRYERALAIWEKALGRDHSRVALSLNNLAVLYQAQGAYGKAEPLHERALAIREKALGRDHPEVATSLNNLASIYHAQGAYGKAESRYERALAILEKALGRDHPDVAMSLNNLAVLYRTQGAYGKAEPLHERALAIREKTLGHNHPHVADSLNNLAELYRVQGVYGKAESLLERALAIREKALGRNHPDVATSLNNLASIYHAQGVYGKAEPLLERALAIDEKASGRDHLDVATSLNNLASIYHAQGAYGKAEPRYERALAIREKGLGRDHPDVATSLNNLALIYQAQGVYGKAEPLLERALAILEKGLGRNHPNVAKSLSNLAVLYMVQGAYRRAEPLLERALAIEEKMLGRDHPDVAMSLINLAALYDAQGAPGKADLLLERALDIHEKALDRDHPDAAMSLRLLAGFHHDRGNHDSALKPHRRALAIDEKNLARTLTVADEARRLAYASKLSESMYYALSLHLRVVPEHDAVAELALTTLLRRKNRVQDLVAQSSADLRRSLPDDDRHLLDEFVDVDSQIAVLSSVEPDKLGAGAFSQQLDELGKARDALWSELAKHSALVGSLEHPISIGDVQRALPDSGSALVEIAQYVPQHGDDGRPLQKHERKQPARYAAYILFPTHFTWVDLGPAAPIDQHVKAFRRAIQTKQAIPTDLYDAVMRPIVAKLGGARHLIIAPAGDLSLIPFGALYDGKRYLIEQYDLRYVTTGRDLLLPPVTPPVATTPIAIIANPTGAGLHDAELEADAIASMFPKTRILRGDQATETNVRTIERPLVFHLATHGFFGQAHHERDNPMFRSGLYLADVEKVKVDREHDDGQLTAYEVSGMDLRGTQLVVLSGCETGLGAEAKPEGKTLMSEGVFGLRRAFATAGARTTVMSLWEVSGVTTQTTMESYYRKLAEGMGRGEAMQAVQLELMRSEEHAHPKDWAAFIVSGDDTPMEFPTGEEPRVAESSSLDQQGPPPVRGHTRCTLAAPSSGRESSVFAFFLAILGLGAVRRRLA